METKAPEAQLADAVAHTIDRVVDISKDADYLNKLAQRMHEQQIISKNATKRSNTARLRFCQALAATFDRLKPLGIPFRKWARDNLICPSTNKPWGHSTLDNYLRFGRDPEEYIQHLDGMSARLKEINKKTKIAKTRVSRDGRYKVVALRVDPPADLADELIAFHKLWDVLSAGAQTEITAEICSAV
jgi:hypothetical protein